jgi:hypothetical protein
MKSRGFLFRFATASVVLLSGASSHELLWAQDRATGSASRENPAFVSRGPLSLAERSPLYRLFLTPPAAQSAMLPRGALSIEVGVAHSSVFHENQSVQVFQYFDLEQTQTSVTLRHGVSDAFEMGLRLGAVYGWGGVLDPTIQWVHRALGLPNAGRDRVQNHAYSLWLEGRNQNGFFVLDLPPGLGLEPPHLLAGWRISGGTGQNHAVSARGTWKLPGGDPRGTSGRGSAALEFAARKSWPWGHLHLSGGGVLLNSPPALAPIMRPAAVLGSAAVELPVSPTTSLVAQFTGSSAYTRPAGFPALDRGSMNFGLGLRGDWGPWIWQGSFAEDVPANRASVDFTFAAHLGRQW